MRETILLIEDEKLMRVTLEDALKSAGYDVVSFETGTGAMDSLMNNPFDVIVTDVRLPDVDGLSILKKISSTNDAQVIVMTAFGTIKDAVEAMKLGAFDYITKPFSLDEFLLLIERALDVKRLKDENIRLKKDLSRCYCFPNIIGESHEMKKVYSLVEKVADSDSTVLILGESGTGKELIATTIHYQSKRKDKPLIKVNCAAMPEGLIESELFGHEKGAFTGAIKRKPGRFELASGGTIFLDEIGDIPLSTQSKILRVIQERQFERVGGTETLNVDVRIIAATNRNLEEEVKRGNFREDLYYRLNVIPITLPPLRNRKEDIPYLIDFFLDKCKNKLSRNISFSKDAIDALLAYDYPGNIRELENIVERCVTLSTSDTIQKDDLPPFIVKKPDNKYLSLSDIAAEAEKEHIIRILKTTKGNKTRAAEMLGISRKTLWEKMNAYRIEL
ncbi:MAG: sigma-54 dependent transcriptional regulator [Nitrospiraceae bacterium]|jgi:two-component system response regulator AtoC|nr:sigma-54 dependent transcriptional regulator [Nitrospirota bacterium]MDA8339551.1 sigma-54 dependent transcriptional regulator [Nitrospiraceae bacterium]